MSQLFDLLDYGIVFKMGPCGFIPVQLSIFCPDLGLSIPLLKRSMGKWFRSFCPGLVAWLRWKVVGWLVGSIQLAVSVLRLFPSGVIICLGYDIRLSMQARKYFSFPALIVLLTFCSILLLAIFAIDLLTFGSIVSLAIILLFSSFFRKGSHDISEYFPLSHFFSSAGVYYHYWR